MKKQKVRIRILGANNELPWLKTFSSQLTVRRISSGDKLPDSLEFSDTKEFPENAWILEWTTVGETKIADHCKFFASVVEKNQQEFENLRLSGAKVEILCSITTDEFITLFHVPSQALGVFCRAGIEVGLSVINLKGTPQNV